LEVTWKSQGSFLEVTFVKEMPVSLSVIDENRKLEVTEVTFLDHFQKRGKSHADG
jgi:hypothetical protein